MTTRNIQTRPAGRRPATRRAQGDRGTSLLEFALVGPLLLLIVIAMINFGLILSFKQDITRAAAEGARGGAVAVPTIAGQSYSTAATAAANSATNDAVKQINNTFKTTGCNTTGGPSCTYVVGACASQAGYQCVTVTVDYDYGSRPLFGSLPIVKAFLPNHVKATSVARING
jgi:Flp pilus assembly protein TadG